MKVIYTKDELTKELDKKRQKSLSIGFVPTMGALHEGHLSLIKESRKNCDVSVVSIFVNPTQFNNPEDLKNYPRDTEKDLKLVESIGGNIVFIPEVLEMYPEEDNRQFEFGDLGNIMEGAKRPGHFNGVAQIVSKLFYIVQPDKAFFGMKDFQQIAIVSEMVRLLKIDVEIVPCSTVREKDGLAMSSRNLLLTKEQREDAPIIYKTMKEAINKIKTMNPKEIKEWITNTINSRETLRTEYVEIVSAKNLKETISWNEDGEKAMCLAVFAGNVRLIDNILIK